jgi:hypothetical protein
METITLEPKTKKEFNVIKAIADALKISVKKDTECPYNPEFVKKIERSMADKKAGKGVRVSIEEFTQLCQID